MKATAVAAAAAAAAEAWTEAEAEIEAEQGRQRVECAQLGRVVQDTIAVAAAARGCAAVARASAT